MLFSSISFIYYFLPLLLIIYYIVASKHRNLVLLIFSLIFYSLGEPKYILLLLLSCLINYYLSKLIYKSKHSKRYLILSLIFNIGTLIIFKYTDFLILNINNILKTSIPLLYITLPIGISFFTFQALGYVIDVYRKKCKPADNILEFMTYISLFPQLIAGPIIRYIDVSKELKNRSVSFEKTSEGIKRFTIGLAKKVLIANVLGEFALNLTYVDILSSWLKPILFTLQIYFDFSGYSDMAIGLGLMFGFRFLENFNYPLTSSSIKDFWGRWHISLSSFFKDYVYIPLGGSKVSKLKWIRNILIVWLLTGLWHGASWNFIIWGLYFCTILIIEKLFLHKFLNKIKMFKYLYTLIIVIISFMIFNETNTKDILINIKNMFFINNLPFTSNITNFYLRNNIVLLIISCIGATPLMSIIIKRLKNTKLKPLINTTEPLYYIILLILSTAFLIDASYNPFLYFRF